jgi:hypothetical protein
MMTIKEVNPMTFAFFAEASPTASRRSGQSVRAYLFKTELTGSKNEGVEPRFMWTNVRSTKKVNFNLVTL